MKKCIAMLLALALVLGLAGCGAAPAVEEAAQAAVEAVTEIFQDVDFAASPFKHINNGGVTGDDILPYNIDAISGATMTVEGPAVVTSIPLSVRELENRTDGIVRGTYLDPHGLFAYEGLDLYYLLYDMVEGDNGIRLTDTAYRVSLKNSNRADIAEFTLQDVIKAHDDNRPIILAYGIGTPDCSMVAPFVFDAKAENEHSLGYIEELGNDDGCIKLVYDLGSYGDNAVYTEFSNVAYVYVREETEPGFSHTGASGTDFDTSLYRDYIVTFRGSALGNEIDLTVEQLENLVTHDADGAVIGGGIGYSDYYSLANNAYWYVNQYEGLDLYKLLIYLGMDSYEEMGSKLARTTLVSFLAADGAAASESFSVDTLSYPDAFGFYNKNAADLNDGTYVSTNADLVATGYPVLMSYGVNNYPYTINKTESAYLSGLSNSGGPFRVVFGKTQYNHANGSNQVQYLSEVIVGDDTLYNTHRYTGNAGQAALADSTFDVTVNNEDGTELIRRSFTAGEIEDLIFGENVAGNEKKAARVKNHYEVDTGSGYVSGIYEGIDPEYLLMNVIGLPGTNGTATFTNGSEELTVPLETLFATGYNSSLGRGGVPSVIAFAKNGSPMVADSGSKGYVGSIQLSPYLDSDPAEYPVDNAGGPLAVIIPSASCDTCDARSLMNVTGVTIDLIPDSYAHLSGEYASLRNSTVAFCGEGLEQEREFTVEELESMQTVTATSDYSMLTSSGKSYEARYRGIPVYELFTRIGIRSNAGAVTVYADDGSATEFSLSQLKKSYENFLSSDKAPVCAMLAFGTGTVGGDIMQGVPLVAEKESPGYIEDAGNNGGPLKLVVPQSAADEVNSSMCVRNVTAIEVAANDVTTWSHSMSDIYEEFLDAPFRLTIRNDSSEWNCDFTVGQLEAMTDLIVRASYTVLDIGECEGLNIWKLIQKVGAGVEGIDNPISITAYAKDDYKNDMLSVVYRDGFEKGVETASGDRLPVLLCYAVNGYPVVDDENHPGYTGLAGNTAGPLRCVVEGTQGASVKYCVKIVVTVPGDGELNISYVPETPVEG